MKKRLLTAIGISFVSLTLLVANMAAPRRDDVSSTVTLAKNDAIAVLDEELIIRVSGAKAQISANYRMKNLTDAETTTAAMFLSPNIENESAVVKKDDVIVPYETASYRLDFDSTVATDDWRFTILQPVEEEKYSTNKVDVVEFELTFLPRQESVVSVVYNYFLGGYPDYDFNAKRGTLHYYLTPASSWADFTNLTIDLYLDEDMPVLKRSNLDFGKVAERQYRYKSDKLPGVDLDIVIDETPLQEFIGSFKSPYFKMGMKTIAPFIVIGAALIVLIVVICFRKRKKKLIK